MADKSKKTVSSDDLKRQRSRRDLAVWLAIVLSAAAALAAGIAFGVLAIVPQWFAENPRMVVRRIELTSPPDPESGNFPPYNGYWSSHKVPLMTRLEIREPMSLWQIDPGELRRKLEDPGTFSSIRSARVYRIPPDILRIALAERYALATVRGSNNLAVDENAMLFDLRESRWANFSGRRPRISLNAPGNRPGVRDSRLIPAVALIMEVNRGNDNKPASSKLDVLEVRLESDSMVCRFVYGNHGGERRAVFPLRDHERNLPIQLQALRSALAELRQEGLERREFDLSFDGQVVIKDDQPDNAPKKQNLDSRGRRNDDRGNSSSHRNTNHNNDKNKRRRNGR